MTNRLKNLCELIEEKLDFSAAYQNSVRYEPGKTVENSRGELVQTEERIVIDHGKFSTITLENGVFVFDGQTIERVRYNNHKLGSGHRDVLDFIETHFRTR